MDNQAHRKKTLGVLGGMGPAATHRLFGQIIEFTCANTDQDHLRVIIDSDSTIPDRTAFLLGKGESPVPHLLASARRLEAAGAELIAMPCNTASAFLPEIRSKLKTPIVDWIAVAVDSASERTAGPIGLLATTGTVATGLYQQALDERGREVVLPTDSELKDVMDIIYGSNGVKSGHLDHHTRLYELVTKLADRGAGAVILGCSELPLVLDPNGSQPRVPLVDPSEEVARAAIIWSGAHLRNSHSVQKP